MRTIWLTRISLNSYIALCTIISACLGFMFGVVLMVVVFVFGVKFSFSLDHLNGDSRLIGIVLFFIGPFLGGIVGLIGSVLTYPLFRLILRWVAGLNLTGAWRLLDPR